MKLKFSFPQRNYGSYEEEGRIGIGEHLATSISVRIVYILPADVEDIFPRCLPVLHQSPPHPFRSRCYLLLEEQARVEQRQAGRGRE